MGNLPGKRPKDIGVLLLLGFQAVQAVGQVAVLG